MGIPHDYTERKRSDEQCLSTLKSEKPNFRDGHYRGAPVRLGRAGGENYRTVALFSTLAVGLQNLYSSVRFRPAPPSKAAKNPTTYSNSGSLIRSAKPGDYAAGNGEGSAKSGIPSDFRPTLRPFRPTLAGCAHVCVGARE